MINLNRKSFLLLASFLGAALLVKGYFSFALQDSPVEMNSAKQTLALQNIRNMTFLLDSISSNVPNSNTSSTAAKFAFNGKSLIAVDANILAQFYSLWNKNTQSSFSDIANTISRVSQGLKSLIGLDKNGVVVNLGATANAMQVAITTKPNIKSLAELQNLISTSRLNGLDQIADYLYPNALSISGYSQDQMNDFNNSLGLLDKAVNKPVKQISLTVRGVVETSKNNVSSKAANNASTKSGRS